MVNSSNYIAPSLERNTAISQTVPDMSITVRQMMDRHNAGGAVAVFKPVFTGESNILPDNFERMDKIERQQLARSLGDFVATTRDRLITQRAATKRAQEEKLIVDRYLGEQAKLKAEAEKT